MGKASWVLAVMACFMMIAVSGQKYARAQDLDEQARANLDAQASEALETLYANVTGAETLGNEAVAMLIFPKIAKGGFIIGGQYGEGVLRIDGVTYDYYNIAGASLGLQLGIQEFALILMFMEQSALDEFRASSGWKAGVSATVAMVQFGAQGSIDTKTANRPIIAFPFSHKGAMAGVSMQGAKFSRFE